MKKILQLIQLFVWSPDSTSYNILFFPLNFHYLSVQVPVEHCSKAPYRELSCDGIEANVDGVLEVWRQRDLRTLLLLLLVCCNMERGAKEKSTFRSGSRSRPTVRQLVEPLVMILGGVTHSCPRRGKWSAGGPSCFSLREPWAAVWRRDWATRSPGSYCSFSGAAPAVSPQYRHYQTSLAALTKSWETEEEMEVSTLAGPSQKVWLQHI